MHKNMLSEIQMKRIEVYRPVTEHSENRYHAAISAFLSNSVS